MLEIQSEKHNVLISSFSSSPPRRINAPGEALAQQELGDVAVGVAHAAEQEAAALVGDALEHDVDVALQQAQLDEVARLFGEGLGFFVGGVEGGALEAGELEGDEVHGGEEEGAQRGAVAHILDDG